MTTLEFLRTQRKTDAQLVLYSDMQDAELRKRAEQNWNILYGEPLPS